MTTQTLSGAIRERLLDASPLLSGVLAVILAVGAQNRLVSGKPGDAILLYGMAIALWIYLFRAQDHPSPATLTRARPMRIDFRLQWICLLPLALAVGLSILGLWLMDVEHPSLLAWGVHIASVMLVLISTWLLDTGARNSTGARANLDESDRPVWPWWPAVWLLLVVGLGAALRLYRITDLPFGTWYDEARNGLESLRILREPGYFPLFVDAIHAPAHYLYLVAASMKMFGVSTQAIRFVSVMMGLLTIFAVYLVGKEWYGWRMGLVLAFLIAVSRWHITFSRIGMYNISTPLFELLALFFLLRGIRRGRFLDFALSGLCLGLGFNFYSVFQLFLVVIAQYLLILMVMARGFWQRRWVGLVFLALTAVLVAAPVVHFAYENPDIYFKRVKQTSVYARTAPEDRLAAIGDTLRKHLLMFNYRGDPNGRHNLPGEPMLDPVTGALMVLGLALALSRLSRARSLLLVAWLLLMLMGGVFSLRFEAPQSLRSIGTLPVVYILAATVVYELWMEWRRTRQDQSQVTFWLPVVLLLVVVAYSNAHTYFVRQANNFKSWTESAAPETIAAQILKELGEDVQPYMMSYYSKHPTVQFLAPDAKDYKVFETTDYVPIVQSPDRDLAVLLDTARDEVFQELRQYYPDATFEEIGPPFDGPAVLLYAYVSGEDLASIQGLSASYYADAQWSGDPAVTQKDASLQFNWPEDAPMALPFSVQWEGVLHAPSYGTFQFSLQAPSAAQLYIDENLVLDGEGSIDADWVLAKGHHSILVRAVGAPGNFELAWTPPGGTRVAVPSWFLYVPPVAANGLLGEYYANDEWERPAGFAEINPQIDLYFHNPPLARPYTIEWTGKIAAPEHGTYEFALHSVDESMLSIDDQQVISPTTSGEWAQGSIDLKAGLHDIVVRYIDRTLRTYVTLHWTPPGGSTHVVPSSVLYPPRGDYSDVEILGLNELDGLH